jgi:O-antigen ligase
MALGVLFARNQSSALFQLRNHFIYVFLLYLVMVQFIDTSFKVEKYIRLFLILSFFMGFMGIAYKAMLPVPVLADENDFALFMNILIPIGYFLGQEANIKWKKFFYYSTIVVFVIANITSFSRGGFVGLLAVGVFLFFKSRNKIAALLLVGFFASTMFIYAPDNYWDRINTIYTQGAQEGTGKERVESWKAGWRMFLDNPIVGVGPNNFGIWLPEYFIQYGSKAPDNLWGRAAHSLYITLLSETGLAGALLFALMLWNNFKDYKYIENLEKTKANLLKQAKLSKDETDHVSVGIRRLHFISLGYSGAMIGFLSTGAFLSVLWYGYFWMLTSFWVMTVNVAKNIEQMLLERSSSNKYTVEQHQYNKTGEPQ